MTGLFDLFEYPPAQRAAVVISSFRQDQRQKIMAAMAPNVMHLAAHQAVLRRDEDDELREAVIRDFLGIETPPGKPDLTAWLACLHKMADNEIDVVTHDLSQMLLLDRDAAKTGHYENQLYFRDLLDAHKVSLILWLTNTSDSNYLERVFGEEERQAIQNARKMASQFNLRTKLRVVRELLELSLTEAPKPNAQEEFARLALALNSVNRTNHHEFLRKIARIWPSASQQSSP